MRRFAPAKPGHYGAESLAQAINPIAFVMLLFLPRLDDLASPFPRPAGEAGEM
jgi:hypothetical protein